MAVRSMGDAPLLFCHIWHLMKINGLQNAEIFGKYFDTNRTVLLRVIRNSVVKKFVYLP